MVARAREGSSVVRLKGGDPFVFGRGGEEALALHAAGISYEVVPGVTAGVAAAAYAGIPVTHRGLASAVALITGHTRADDPPLAAPDSVAEEAASAEAREPSHGAHDGGEVDLDWQALATFPGNARALHGRAPPAPDRRVADRRRAPRVRARRGRGTWHARRPAHRDRHVGDDRRAGFTGEDPGAVGHRRGGGRRACRATRPGCRRRRSTGARWP